MTKKVEKIIETLRATEFLENSEFKAAIGKLSAIIGKTGESLFNHAEVCSKITFPFLLDFKSLYQCQPFEIASLKK